MNFKTMIQAAVALTFLVAMPVLTLAAEPAPVLPELGDGMALIGLGGLIISASSLKNIYTGFQTVFNQGFRETDPQWSKVATLVPSSTAQENYGWLGQFPKLREWAGDRQVQNLKAHDYSIKNRKYESTVAVGRDEIEDDQYGVYNPVMQEMGYAAATHPDELVFSLLADGFNQACYDNQNFFDTDHPVGDGTTSNMQSGTGEPWFLLDTRRPLKPLIFQRRRDYSLRSLTDLEQENVFMRDEYMFGVDARVSVGFGFWQQAFGSKDTLDDTNFKAARAAMMKFQSDEGRPLRIRPNVLVVGPSNLSAAEEVVGVRTLSDGSENPLYQAADILLAPELG